VEALWLEAQCVTTLAQALIDSGEFALAQHRIDDLRAKLAGMKNPFFNFSLGIVEAYCRLRQRDESRGTECLCATLALARKSGYVNYFVWSPKTMGYLCDVALRHDIEVDYVKSLVSARGVLPPDNAGERWPWPIRIFTLGGFRVLVNGQPVTFGRKAPKQLLRLLKALVALGSVNVPAEKILDALWSDLEGDAGHAALSISVRRLRTLLGDAEAVHQQAGLLCWDKERCWIDALAFEQLLDSAEEPFPGNRERAFALYRGTFLPDESNATWTFELRDRLHRKFTTPDPPSRR
jgi:hypothetical protein